MKNTLLLLLCCSFLQAQFINLENFATGFNRPVDISHANDSRLFIVEQDGVIKIVNADGTTNPIPFLDIDARVRSTANEQGLLGLAFHPNYQTNGYFYVNYVTNSNQTSISRFTVSSDANVADPNSELVILTYAQPFTNHNGGDLAFGPDGFLYIGSGDGGSGGDPGNRAQNNNQLLGKILRIDVDNGSPYAIPAGNPFAGAGDTRSDEIWLYGLRNPWRISFDRDNGDLWIGDVGQNAFEEIDVVTNTQGGNNLGWRCYEASTPFNTTGCPGFASTLAPVAEYSISGGSSRCSVTGGFRYRGSQNPSYTGLYFFSDFCSDEIATLTLNAGNWTPTYYGPFLGNNFSTFGEDMAGELYVAGLSSGIIYKINDNTLSIDQSNLPDFKISPNPANKTVTLNLDEINIGEMIISLIDISGKTVLKKSYKDPSNVNFSVEQLANGIYILKLTDEDNRSYFKKLVVN